MSVEEFYEIVGGDYKDLTNRISKVDLIERFLRKYADSQDVNNLILAYEEKDYKKMFECSHNLKGMLANLSLKKMVEPISLLCELVRNGEPDQDLTPYIETIKNNQKLFLDTISNL